MGRPKLYAPKAEKAAPVTLAKLEGRDEPEPEEIVQEMIAPTPPKPPLDRSAKASKIKVDVPSVEDDDEELPYDDPMVSTDVECIDGYRAEWHDNTPEGRLYFENRKYKLVPTDSAIVKNTELYDVVYTDKRTGIEYLGKANRIMATYNIAAWERKTKKQYEIWRDGHLSSKGEGEQVVTTILR